MKPEYQGRKLLIGIIGTGGIAHAHMDSYTRMTDIAEVVALADLVPGKAQAFAKEFGLDNVKCYTSHTELLADADLKLDAVSICTYNRQHTCCAIDAMRKGLHVLLEKPLCVTTEEAIAIRKVEKETGCILSVGFQPRMDANMQEIKRIVQSGALGKVYYIQTGGGRRRGIPVSRGTTFIEDSTAGIGAMADIGCYSLDMVLNAVGYPKPLTVTGYTSKFLGTDPETYPGHPEIAEKFEVDDFAAGFIRLEGGIILDFRISWALNINTPGDTLVLGTKAGLRIPSTDCWNGTIGGPMTLYRTVNGENIDTVLTPIDDHGHLFDRKVRSFLEAVLNGTEPPVPTSQIIINQAIIDGIVKSAACGHEVEINLPEI